MFRCFLSHKLQQIKQVVDGILKSIFKFHALLRLGHWEEDESGQFVHTEYDAIIKTYLPFKEFTQFLNKGKHVIIMRIILYTCVISQMSWTDSWLYFQGPNCKKLFFYPAKLHIDNKSYTNIFGYTVLEYEYHICFSEQSSVVLRLWRAEHIASDKNALTLKKSL